MLKKSLKNKIRSKVQSTSSEKIYFHLECLFVVFHFCEEHFWLDGFINSLVDFIKMSSEKCLAVFNPLSHSRFTLTKVFTHSPVLGYFTKEKQICNWNLITCDKLPILEKVAFNNIYTLLQCSLREFQYIFRCGLSCFSWQNALWNLFSNIIIYLINLFSTYCNIEGFTAKILRKPWHCFINTSSLLNIFRIPMIR